MPRNPFDALSYLVPMRDPLEYGDGPLVNQPPPPPPFDPITSEIGLPKMPGETRVVGGYWYRAELKHRFRVMTDPENPLKTNTIDEPYLDWKKYGPSTKERHFPGGRVERYAVDIAGNEDTTPFNVIQGIPKEEMEVPGGVITDKNDPRLNTNIKPNPDASPTGDWVIGTVKTAEYDTQGHYKGMGSVNGWVPAKDTQAKRAEAAAKAAEAAAKTALDTRKFDVSIDPTTGIPWNSLFAMQKNQNDIARASWEANIKATMHNEERAKQEAAIRKKEAETGERYGALYDAIRRGYVPASNPFANVNPNAASPGATPFGANATDYLMMGDILRRAGQVQSGQQTAYIDLPTGGPNNGPLRVFAGTPQYEALVRSGSTPVLPTRTPEEERRALEEAEKLGALPPGTVAAHFRNVEGSLGGMSPTAFTANRDEQNFLNTINTQLRQAQAGIPGGRPMLSQYANPKDPQTATDEFDRAMRTWTSNVGISEEERQARARQNSLSKIGRGNPFQQR